MDPADMMTAVLANGSGGPEVLALQRLPVPAPGPGQVLIRVAAAGVNRPDIMQRAGQVAPPAGATPVLGLEVAGVVVATGSGVDGGLMHSRAMALVNGGGYAGYCVAEAAHCLPVPAGLSDEEAAALPEALFTLWHNLYELGRLAPGDTVLLHGAASGLGTLGIQLASRTGASVVATAGSDAKCAALRRLGAACAVNYRSEDFVAAALQATEGRGVDVVLDIVGGAYIERNLAALAPGGRHVSIAFLESAQATVNLQTLMSKSLTMTSSTLRPKSNAEKARIADCVRRRLLPQFADGRLKPCLHAIHALADVARAHQTLDDNANIGKVVLSMTDMHS